MELPGIDHLPFVGDNAGEVADLIQEFLTGSRAAALVDRVLATVLFTDIVGATEKAAALGDRRWRDLLLGHHTVVREQLARFRGREIDTAATGSSPPSTGRRARSGAPRRSCESCVSSACRSAPASTPASAR